MMQKRWSEIQNIWQKNQVLYVIAGFLAGILFFPAIEALSTDASELLSGFVPEAVGIAFTVLLIDRLYQRRDSERQERELKTRLVREAGSPVNATALNALRELDGHDLLAGEDGALQGANLAFANLYKADLIETNLRGAYLAGANLHGADLSMADLSDANMQSANLLEAELSIAIFNENTKLPDLSYWMPGIDMERFTDKDHPHFYKPMFVEEFREHR